MIGFNKNGEIKEIVKFSTNDKISYRLRVHEIKHFRILLVADERGRNAYYQTAIVMDKNSGMNFLISSALRIGENMGTIYLADGGFDLGTFDQISTLTILDAQLYPSKTLRIKNGQVVFSCDIKYSADRKVDFSFGYFFLSKEDHPGLIVNRESCLQELVDKCVRPEMLFELRLGMHGVRVEPLWDMFGQL
jgi:hypothetical protein